MRTKKSIGYLVYLFLIFQILTFQITGITVYAKISFNNIQTVSQDGFRDENGQVVYVYEDGSYAKNCLLSVNDQYYCFNKNGVRISGWKKIEGAYYYFGTNEEGYMYRSKWLKTKQGNYYYLQQDGKTAVGWTKIGKKEFYFNARGKRLYGLQTIDGKTYYLGTINYASKRCSKLFRLNKKTYYAGADGSLVTGWQTVDGNKYYFGENYQAYTGTQQIDGVTYKFGSTGKLQESGPNISVTCDCAILVDAESGAVLFSKNADTQHANASTTKIMTCILALEKCDLSETVTASEYAVSMEPTKLYMNKGESFVLKDLLYSLMVPSHNDTAVAIAEHISGSESKFANLMNQKAKEIGCTNTHFSTPNGLDNYQNEKGETVYYEHYTTAYDMAKIARYAWKNSTFRQIVGTTQYSFKSKQGRSFTVTTTNSLLNTMAGVKGIKTGYTQKAGYCFAGYIQGKNGKGYISVVLGGKTSASRWTDTKNMLSYAYNLESGANAAA